MFGFEEEELTDVKKFKIIILLIVVIAVGWGIGKYTSPSASESNGSNINVGDNLQGEPGDTGKVMEGDYRPGSS